MCEERDRIALGLSRLKGGKTPEMKKFANQLVRALGGVGLVKGRCALCGRWVTKESFRDSLSLKEFGISGMCQVCQDEVFG